MHIIWHGQSFFQILVNQGKGEQITLAIDPFGEAEGVKPPSFNADILFVTHDHEDHNNKKAIRGEPFVIEGPGEYEIKEVFVRGIPSFHDDENGKSRGQNTIYTIEAEEMRLCHLGDLGQKELTPDQLEQIGDVDILMIPAGEIFTVSAKEANHIISQIEPRIVIPMHYQLPKFKTKLESVDKFLKEIGRKSLTPQPKLLIKKKDLPQETQVVLLQP